jgi:hypothetical protein
LTAFGMEEITRHAQTPPRQGNAVRRVLIRPMPKLR